MVTETWFKGTKDLEQTIQDMQDGLGYGCIRRDRVDGSGGGVAIVYKTGDLCMTQLKVRSEFEIVAALGRRTGQRRKLIVITAYIPPSLDADSSDRAMDVIVNLVGTFKRKYDTPYFLLGGDFNKRNIQRELKVYPDLKLEITPPTRGNNHLDLIFSNFPQYITRSGVTDPIFNLTGTETDHMTVFVNAKMPRVPEYKTESYSYYKQTVESDKKMCLYLKSIDWQYEMRSAVTPTEMVEVLHSKFKDGMDMSYELKKSTKKSSEPPWITAGIRRLIRRRRAVFRKWGRNEVWKQMKRKTSRLIRNRKKAYNLQKKDKIINASKNGFHDCVKAFINNEKEGAWTPLSLFPGADKREVAERMATFFNNISNEYQPLDLTKIPHTFDANIPTIRQEDIIKEVKEGKKPRSRVDGDIFINVLSDCITELSKPIARILNAIPEQNEWPSQWKTEHVTIIPKCKRPENESECRNISCTNFLSKLYERFVLKWCQNYVTPKQNQFGGQKGCSTYHFLAETWDQLTDHLEDSRAASVLTAIDYSKAFNRIEHLPLLQSFADKGAPTQIIRLLASFLQWLLKSATQDQHQEM